MKYREDVRMRRDRKRRRSIFDIETNPFTCFLPIHHDGAVRHLGFGDPVITVADYANIERRIVAHEAADLPPEQVKAIGDKLDKLAEDVLLGKTHTGRLAKP